MRSGRSWTDAELFVLREHRDQPIRDLADALSRSQAEVGLMLARLRGGHHRRLWTAADDARLRELADLPIALQAEALGRTESAITTRRSQLGISPPRPYRPWTAREVTALARMTLAEARAAHPDRTPASVYAARWTAINGRR